MAEARARIAAQVEEERGANDRFLAKALALASAAVPAQSGTATLLVDGQSNLLSATEDVDRAKRVLRTLEERDLIVRLLDRTVAAPGHLRVHWRRGQSAGSHRHFGGHRDLWR